MSVSVVIPVRDGERYLAELLAALAAQGDLEILVIDSGSRDRSRHIARAAGVEVLELAPGEFGHGRTRNLGAQRTSGELICFLTQDATPVPGWLTSFREAFELDPRVGAAFGPHLPRPETSPMIARELTEFFAGFAPDGQPTLQRGADDPYLSNVNACYARACWEEIRFRDVPYAEDQAFGRDMLAAGWTKVFHPGAAVLHAHDYGTVDFMRRYFDEYRGLRETVGYVEHLGLRSTLRTVEGLVAADRRWMRERGFAPRARATWTARSAAHHGGRKVAAALGSRAERLPSAVRGALSLEARRDGVPAPASPVGPPATERVAPRPAPFGGETITRVLREGPAPLAHPAPDGPEGALHVAVAIPAFTRGSGGHGTIFQLVSQLEALGHTCSIWMHDTTGGARPGAVVRRQIVEQFTPVRAPVFAGFDEWYGADVAVATGWQTVYPVLTLPACRGRAYLVQDHEPEFYETSIESYWAARTYELGLHCIAASPWLLEQVAARRSGPAGSVFHLGIDHDTYHPRAVPRRRDTVVFYARSVTPRRAVPLGLLALEELHRRRPRTRIVMFGDYLRHPTSFPYERIEVASPEQLAWLYSQATVGLSLSMTNYSLVGLEMLGCGLPCVDLAGFSSETVYGEDGPVELVDVDPVAIADAVERLIDEPDRWRRRSRAGLDFVRERTWERAAREVEAGLRAALRQRDALARA